MPGREMKKICTVVACLVLLGGCGSDTQKQSDLNHADGPNIGKADSMDRADHDCQVVLRAAIASANCVRSNCTLTITAYIDVSDEALEAGAIPAFLFSSNGRDWFEGWNQPKEYSRLSLNYQRFEWLEWTQTFPDNPTPDIHLIPFIYEPGGGRAFDHNRNQDVYTNYLLSQQVNGMRIGDDSDVCRGNQAVRLVRAHTEADSYQGASGSCVREFQVKIYDMAGEKEVSIHHSTESGEWIDLPLEFSHSVEENHEIWTLRDVRPIPLQPPIPGEEFIVKYAPGGQTYWDNNDGGNYFMGEVDGSYLGDGINVSVYRASLTEDDSTGDLHFSGSIDVRNIAAEKSVKVIYSNDNWASTDFVSAQYVSVEQVGYSQFIYSPNVHGVEIWRFNTVVPQDTSTLQFAVLFEVDGKSYWDNNFGIDYTLAR